MAPAQGEKRERSEGVTGVKLNASNLANMSHASVTAWPMLEFNQREDVLLQLKAKRLSR